MTMQTPADALQVLDFWFRELRPAQWFEGGAALDAQVRARFAPLLERARRGECDAWCATPRGRLALVIVLDQFSRHVYRDQGEAYASDERARQLTLEAIDRQEDAALNVAEQQFLYLPLMHAEDAAVQQLSVQRYIALRDFADQIVQFAEGHRRQVERFGRFPSRNAALGRDSTVEERAFIASGEGWVR